MVEICNKNLVVVVNRFIKFVVYQEEIKCLYCFNYVFIVLILVFCKVGLYLLIGMELCFLCEKGYY